jgi:hypothetical protein
MAAAKQIQVEHFNPKQRSPRHEQTERAYRNAVYKALAELLKVVNPRDEVHWRGMKYEDLVTYARDWLQTEVEVVSGVEPEPAEEPGLGLDLG